MLIKKDIKFLCAISCKTLNVLHFELGKGKKKKIHMEQNERRQNAR